MAVVIRMRRMGRKNMDIFRVVVADKRSPRDGRFIENVGEYDPNREPPHIKLKLDRIQYWISKGAKPSVKVASLIKKYTKANVIDN